MISAIAFGLCLQAAISGIVWVNVLCKPNGFMGFLPGWFEDILNDKVYFAAFQCAKCNSAYWLMFYLLIYLSPVRFVLPVMFMLFDTIFIAYLFSLIINRIE